MRHHAQISFWQRSAALALAAILALTAFPALAAEGEEEQPAEDEVVQCTDFSEIFTTTIQNMGDPLLINGNTIHLADGVHEYQSPSQSTSWASESQIQSEFPVSLKANWEFLADFTIDNFGYGCCNSGGFFVGDYLFFVGASGTRVGIGVRYNNAFPALTPLTTTQVYGTKRYRFSYSAATRKFTIEISDPADVDENGLPKVGSSSYHTMNYASPFAASLEDTSVIFYGGVDNKQQGADKRLPDDKQIEATFIRAAYTDYKPVFVSTTLLDKNGAPFPEGTVIQDGTEVTIQAKVKNGYENGGTVQCHLQLSDSKDYPTAGLSFPDTADQTVTIDGVETADVNITGEGIPFDCSPTETVITYKAVVDNSNGAAVTVGQMMLDDFFQSKRHSGDTLIPPIELVPLDPEKPVEEQGEAGKDYHYTRTPANENGWNNADVSIVFFPGDFSEFHIVDNKNVSDVHYLVPGNTTQAFTDELGGKELGLQAHNPTTGEMSTLKDDTVKIDKTAPALAAGAGGALTLTDGLAGVWKLERYDAASKSWVTAQEYPLTDGNGAASQTHAVAQNGRYRVVDAAGNASAAQAVTVNDPPAVTPADPSATLPVPEQSTDENGLTHALITDSMQESIDREAPLYGGRFTTEDAKDLFDSRYGFSSNVDRDDGLSYRYTISQGGKDVTGQGVDTTQPGAFTVTCVATDADGNTTTVVLTDTLIDREAPPTVEWGEDPDPPVGPSFDPLKPTPKPVVKEDAETGKKHAYIYDTVTEAVKEPGAYGGKLTAEVAAEILSGRYRFETAQGDRVLTYGPVAVTVEGKEGSLDTAKPGSCVISQTVTDSQGNQTTVYLTYNLLGRDLPPAIDYNPGDETVEPGSVLDEPEIIEDWQNGTKYATVKDRLVQAVSNPPLSGGSLDGDELRAFLQSRYQFTSAQPDGALKEIRFAVTQNGKAVEAIDTTRPGDYLITYTLEDSAGNRTSLFLQYSLREGEWGGQLAGGGAEAEGPYTGEHSNGLPLLSLAAAGGLLALLALKRRADRQG